MSELKLKGKQRQAAASGKLGESAQQKQTRWQPHYAQFSSCHTTPHCPCPSWFDCYTHTHTRISALTFFLHSRIRIGLWRCALPFFLQLFLYFSHSVKFSKCHFAVISWIIRLQLRWNNRIQMKKLCRRRSSVVCRLSSVASLRSPSSVSLCLLNFQFVYTFSSHWYISPPLSLFHFSLSLSISSILAQSSGGATWVQSFHFDCWLSSAIMIKQQGELSLSNSPTSYATHTSVIWQHSEHSVWTVQLICLSLCLPCLAYIIDSIVWFEKQQTWSKKKRSISPGAWKFDESTWWGRLRRIANENKAEAKQTAQKKRVTSTGQRATA